VFFMMHFCDLHLVFISTMTLDITSTEGVSCNIKCNMKISGHHKKCVKKNMVFFSEYLNLDSKATFFAFKIAKYVIINLQSTVWPLFANQHLLTSKGSWLFHPKALSKLSLDFPAHFCIHPVLQLIIDIIFFTTFDTTSLL